jgi:Type II secretion system (T2SS), protein M
MTARDRTILMVVAGLAVLAGFWFLAIGPKHKEAKAASADIATQQQRLTTAQSTLNAGLQAKAGYPRDYATVAELGKAVPADDDLASMLYEVDATSRGSHVAFNSLVRSGGAASADASGSSTPATTASASLPPGATVGTAGLATLPFTFTFNGSYFALQRFLDNLQGFVRADGDKLSVDGRLLTVDGVALTPGAGGLRHIEAKVVATAYLSPSTDSSATGTGSGSATTPPGSAGTSAAAPAPTSSAIAGPNN